MRFLQILCILSITWILFSNNFAFARSPSEKEIIQLARKIQTFAEAARQLNISPKTVSKVVREEEKRTGQQIAPRHHQQSFSAEEGIKTIQLLIANNLSEVSNNDFTIPDISNHTSFLDSLDHLKQQLEAYINNEFTFLEKTKRDISFQLEKLQKSIVLDETLDLDTRIEIYNRIESIKKLIFLNTISCASELA